MTLARLSRPLIAIVAVLSAALSIGGGATFLALEATASPKFCTSCHIMQPYYESWASSSHKNVACVDCHYEPGILETFEGKFKALSQLAKYATGTQGTKPWAEVSDYSCMRSGCHSTQNLEGEIKFGRVRFDHRQHLSSLRRGKRLRCTSCHSQIVQGNHLTVTPTTCFLCHFKKSEGSKGIGDCNVCHGAPTEDIPLEGSVFRHSEYLARGVECKSCHGDVVRGNGDVPKARCGSCHNKQEHLERYSDVEFIHKNHVTDHSVSCLECHMEIEHGLPSREKHYRGECGDCHVGAHSTGADLYRGTGGLDVPDQPAVMYLARVTCNGCHRAPFPGAPVPREGTTYAADPLACIDCHGPGFAGMADRWQAEMKATTADAKAALDELASMMNEEWEEADRPAATRAYDAAAQNLALVLLDHSGGVHNLPYCRELVRKATGEIAAGMKALDPDSRGPRVRIGPAAPSKEGCTNLCHVGVEESKSDRAFDLPFPHARHFTRGKVDCATCHRKEPHGTLEATKATCASCHHKSDKVEQCAACHADVREFRTKIPEGAETTVMGELDCLSCHETLAQGHSRESMMATCDGCHGDDEPDFAKKHYDEWKRAAADPLDALEAELAGAPAALAEEARREIAALRRLGPWHNADYARAVVAKFRARLAEGR